MRANTIKATNGDRKLYNNTLLRQGFVISVSGSIQLAPVAEIRKFIKDKHIGCSLITSFPPMISQDFFDLVFPNGCEKLNIMETMAERKLREKAEAKEKTKLIKVQADIALDDEAINTSEEEAMERDRLVEEANQMLDREPRRRM